METVGDIEKTVLVTGGTGFLGRRLTRRLVAEGHRVRVLARKTSNIEPLTAMEVEIVVGDLADKSSLNGAFKGVGAVVHAAAGTTGTKKDCETVTILGTRNVLELCKANGVAKLVYISSCSVYGVADYKINQLVTEQSSLERHPEQRGHYSASKQQAEALVIEAMKSKIYPVVVLRPGTIYGPGGQVFAPMIGFALANKLFVVIEQGEFELPFVYIDNLVDAILEVIVNSHADNEVFNIVDTDRITKKTYVDKLIRKLYPKAYVVYLPYWCVYWVTWAQERAFHALGRKPFLTTYRLISSQKNISYDCSKIKSTIGWRPRVNFEQAVAAITSSHERPS